MTKISTLLEFDSDTEELSDDELAELDRLYGHDLRIPEPPWRNPLAKKESELVLKSFTDQNPGDTRKADFYISWLAKRYECAPEKVHSAIVYDFNRGSTAWAAFNFRFDDSYQFAHKRLFPQTGKVRKYQVYLWEGRAISEDDAKKLGVKAVEREKKLRAIGQLFVLVLIEPPRPFLKEATKKLHNLTHSQIEVVGAEAKAWLLDWRSNGKRPSLDTLRLRFWDLMLQEVYGEGAYAGQRLVPPSKKLENFENLCLNNKDIVLSVASIYKR
jgi:hypothetical protein